MLVGTNCFCVDCVNGQLSVTIPTHTRTTETDFEGTPEITHFFGFQRALGVVQALCCFLWTFLMWGGSWEEDVGK